VLRADLIALNLSEGSHWIGATRSRGAVHKRAGVGAVQHRLGGDQAPTGVPATNDFERNVGIRCEHRFDKVGNGLPGKSVVGTPQPKPYGVLVN
jgi:hypothetical protein